MAPKDLLTVDGAKLWDIAIAKENSVPRTLSFDKFSVRNALQVMEVPTKFKPQHMEPQKMIKEAARGFRPRDFGLDPQEKTVKEIQRVIREKNDGPRARSLHAQTNLQELGWAVTVPESRKALERRLRAQRIDEIYQKRAERGFAQASAAERSTPKAHPSAGSTDRAPRKRPEEEDGGNRPRSELMWPPPAETAGGDGAAPVHSRVSAAAPSRLSRASSIGAIPSALSVNTGLFSHVTSLPGEDPDVCRKVKKLDIRQAGVLNELERYGPHGDFGERWRRPLHTTDVTHFDQEFIKAASVPLYKLKR